MLAYNDHTNQTLSSHHTMSDVASCVTRHQACWLLAYSCSFGQGSSLLWTHALRPFYNRPIALAQGGEEFG